ncbi:hypothetical protein EMGBS15_00140 [Filimonas sp.]|nr:hypothetical protein EMGBS15_00140 [Filimonas sp.]
MSGEFYFGIWNLEFGISKSLHSFSPPPVIDLFKFQFICPARKNSARIDSSSIQIGDQIHLQLSTTYNPQLYRVPLPSIQDTFNHFEVVERSKN